MDSSPELIGRGSRSSHRWLKTICKFMLIQILLIHNVECANEGFYRPGYEVGQDVEEMENLKTSMSEPELEESGLSLEKRHLGSVAALSGIKEKTQRQRLSPQLELYNKRHLGSVASYSGLKPRNLILSQMEKRYLGAIAAKSGFRSPTSSFRARSSSGGDLMEKDKRHLGAFTKTKAFNRVTKSLDGYEGEGPDDEFYEYPVEITDTEMNPDTDDFYGFQEEPVTIKSKRFLGSLARGNWFPRQYRESTFDKRHIGAAARMGWLPASKFERDIGEGGLKRNIQSFKNIQFATPMDKTWGWGRPREKRMVRV